FVSTPTALQCAGINDDTFSDLPVTLLTTTALLNTLLSGSIFFLSGRFLAPNDGTSPVLNYAQEGLLPLPVPVGTLIDASNKTSIVGLGQVIERCQVVLDNSTQATHLEVVVSHHNWDSQDRCSRSFRIKYIEPRKKNMINTHPLYQVGREVQITLRRSAGTLGSDVVPNGQPRSNLIKLTPRKDKAPQEKSQSVLTRKPTTARPSSKPLQPVSADVKGKGKMKTPNALDEESNPLSSDESNHLLAAPLMQVEPPSRAPSGSRPQGRPH
ncbi:hypothetical protein PCANC_25171, partial [Puccinia coronata f. sp. avenae]